MNKEIVLFQQEIEKTIRKVPVVKIKSNADLVKAKNALAQIGEAQKLVKTRKDSIIQPLNEALRNARDLFGGYEAGLKQMEAALKEELFAYRQKFIQKAEKRIEKLEESVKDGKITMVKAGEKIEVEQDKVDSLVKTRVIREVAITDENKIPDRYWVVDMVKLRKDVLGGVKVVGAKIVEREIIIK